MAVTINRAITPAIHLFRRWWPRASGMVNVALTDEHEHNNDNNDPKTSFH
jgi:hypothetical protein